VVVEGSLHDLFMILLQHSPRRTKKTMEHFSQDRQSPEQDLNAESLTDNAQEISSTL
jgi:hypothetical protein